MTAPNTARLCLAPSSSRETGPQCQTTPSVLRIPKGGTQRISLPFPLKWTAAGSAENAMTHKPGIRECLRLWPALQTGAARGGPRAMRRGTCRSARCASQCSSNARTRALGARRRDPRLGRPLSQRTRRCTQLVLPPTQPPQPSFLLRLRCPRSPRRQRGERRGPCAAAAEDSRRSPEVPGSRNVVAAKEERASACGGELFD